MTEQLSIGDKMRFSVELISDMADRPDRTSVLVVVERIDVVSDGTKIVWVKNAE